MILIALVAATEGGLSSQARAQRLIVGLLMLPLSLMFIPIFQDYMRPCAQDDAHIDHRGITCTPMRQARANKVEAATQARSCAA